MVSWTIAKKLVTTAKKPFRRFAERSAIYVLEQRVGPFSLQHQLHAKDFAMRSSDSLKVIWNDHILDNLGKKHNLHSLETLPTFDFNSS